MTKNKKEELNSQENKRFLDNMPKWLIPIVVIVSLLLIFLIAQYVAIFVLSFYTFLRGWDMAQANAWLNKSITAQFIYVFLAEAMTVGLVYLVLKYRHSSFRELGLKRPRLKDGGLAILGYPTYLIMYIILETIIKHIFVSLNVKQAQNIGFNSVHGVYQLTLTFFSLVIFPPIAEEILFRGFLFEGLKKAMPVFFAGFITCLLFAAAHLLEGGSSGLFWIGAIDIFTLSVVLVYLKQKTKSLWPGIFLHGLNNLIAFITLFLLTNR